MTGSMRDRLRDELAGWPIASSYYSTAVSVDDARDMADALLAAFPWLADEPSDTEVEAGARALATWDGQDWDLPDELFNDVSPVYKSAYYRGARVVLVAAREARMT